MNHAKEPLQETIANIQANRRKREIACYDACAGINPAAVPNVLRHARLLLDQLRQVPEINNGLHATDLRMALAEAERGTE